MRGPGLKKWPVLWDIPPQVLYLDSLSHSCWHVRMAVTLIVSRRHYLSGMLPVTHWLQAKVSDLLAQPGVTSTSSRTKVSLNIQINHENKAQLPVGVNKTHGVFLSLESYFLFVILLETPSKFSFSMFLAFVYFMYLIFIFQTCLLKNVLRVMGLVVGISVLGKECQSWRFLPEGCESWRK